MGTKLLFAPSCFQPQGKHLLWNDSTGHSLGELKLRSNLDSALWKLDVRAHIGWRGERNIPYIGVEIRNIRYIGVEIQNIPYIGVEIRSLYRCGNTKHSLYRCGFLI